MLLVYNSIFFFFFTKSSGLFVGLKPHPENIAILKCLQNEILDWTHWGRVGDTGEMQARTVG